MQGNGPHQVAGVVGPDVVAPLIVQPLQCFYSLLQSAPLLGVGDTVVVKCHAGIVTVLDGIRNILP